MHVCVSLRLLLETQRNSGLYALHLLDYTKKKKEKMFIEKRTGFDYQ